ncbi:transcriptional regulator [Ancylobacter sp. G4_0304]|uniref:transcriptional regulator n=1 Tax=Ancylobacter sp. G4_0304 TaxID=3114289 RepID=UPI0039C63713
MKQTVDFQEKARAGWGDPPDWIVALADACQRETQTAAAKRLGVSGSQVSHVIGRTYAGRYDRIEELVRGVFMGATVECPVLGEIARHRCLEEQARPFAATSSTRAALFRACRGGCPHSRHCQKGEAA